MAHHAYYVSNETEKGIASALAFIEHELGLEINNNPDVIVLRYGLLSVDDARTIRAFGNLSPAAGNVKVLIISTSRFFHEAQNALLKLFEEPPEGTYLVLVIPAEGMLLPTLRSRLMPLPAEKAPELRLPISLETQEFLAAPRTEREKLIGKLLDRARSDKDEEKQAGRLAAVRLVEGLTQAVYQKWQIEKNSAQRKNAQLFLEDLNHFLPILHERSAPLKLIFEHILIVSPL